MKILSSIVILLSFMSTANAFQSWQLVSSRIHYQVQLGSSIIEGTSIGTEGKGECLGKQCQFLLGVPLRTFYSGHTRRDRISTEKLKGDLYPIITVDCITGPSIEIEKAAACTINIGGKSKNTIPAKIESKFNSRGFTTAFEIKINLKDFSIPPIIYSNQRVNENVRVFGNILWKQENKFEF